jgi:uncharacterized protein YuzE
MKTTYHCDDDILEIRISDKPVTREVSHGWNVNISYAEDGSVVEIVLLEAKGLLETRTHRSRTISTRSLIRSRAAIRSRRCVGHARAFASSPRNCVREGTRLATAWLPNCSAIGGTACRRTERRARGVITRTEMPSSSTSMLEYKVLWQRASQRFQWIQRRRSWSVTSRMRAGSGSHEDSPKRFASMTSRSKNSGVPHPTASTLSAKTPVGSVLEPITTQPSLLLPRFAIGGAAWEARSTREREDS